MNPLLRVALFGAVSILGLVRPMAAHAQREVKHLNSLTLQYGKASEGTYYRFGYSRFLSDNVRLDVVALRESGREDHPKTGRNTPYYGYDFGLGIAPKLFRLGEAMYVHLPLQLHGRYDRMTQSSTEASGGHREVTQGFSAGPEIGVTADVYLTNWVSLSGQASQGYLAFRPPVTSWPRYYGGGIRFHFR
ncbi:hypothetical protein [Hymenobacter guriensis]|uniref:Outer membrane protein beta-barrel domain-containing protein n=1 Tax=Hymenobacter guriensis TaxID=2793065 RepID=A0ABS0L871_9BACT|nr:hypothetical protein [Hymenobacter guriensis]MBG8556312.1 hypothetical protein [Hymenobacter guriensis]